MSRIFIKITASLAVISFFSILSLPAQDLQKAIKLAKSEQFAAASTAFKELVAKSPANGDIYYYYGMRFIREYFTDTLNVSLQEVSDSARVIFEEGVRQEPGNALNFVGLGTLSMINKEVSKAQTFFTKVNSMLPSKANKNIVLAPQKHSLILSRMAEAYILTGSHDTATVFTLLRNAEKLDNKNPDLYIAKGDAYIYLLNDGSKAIANYNIAQSLDPKSPEAKLRVGLLWMRARQYQNALETYQEVVRIDSTYAPAYRELGYLLSRANRNAEAQANYKKFLQLSAGNTSARIQYVNILVEQKNYQEAITQLNEIFKTDTTNNDLNRAAAYCYFETGQYEKGLVYAKKFFKNAKPEKIRPADYAYLGRLLAKNKQDSLAYMMLYKAFTVDSTRSELLSEAAMSLNKLKKYDKALEIYNLKITLKKATPNDFYNMGKVYYNLQEYKKVDSILAYYNTLMPDHIQGYQWRARALVNLDPETKEGLAKPVFEMLIEKALSDSVKYSKEIIEAYEYLAYYYFKQYNQTKDQLYGQKGIEYSQKILAIDPNNEKGKAILKELEPKIKH